MGAAGLNGSESDERSRILVFCRPYLIANYRENVRPAETDHDFHFLTDGASPGTHDTRAAFYAALESGARSGEVTAEEEADVIARCRMLRNIDRAMAVRLVHAMAVTLAAEIDRVAPAGILTQMVDEYVVHLLSLLAAKRRIGFVGYCWSYFPEHAMLLADAYGRPFDCREPGDAEIDSVLGEISARAFRQNYNQRDSYRWSAHLYQLARYRAKQLWFAIQARRHRDPWNVHYAMTPFIVERRRLADFPHPHYFHDDWTGELARLRRERPDAPVVYLPLGYFPESTIDYWIGDKRALDYETLAIEMARTLAEDCVVIIKEHLHMMGSRGAAFTKALKAIPGAVSVHPMEFSNDAVAAADAIVLGGGSVGVEATVRGKPVFSFCDTAYWFAPSGATWLDLGAIGGWSARIRERLAAGGAPDAGAGRALIRACLRSTTRSRGEVKFWPLMLEEDLRAVLRRLTREAAVSAPEREVA